MFEGGLIDTMNAEERANKAKKDIKEPTTIVISGRPLDIVVEGGNAVAQRRACVGPGAPRTSC